MTLGRLAGCCLALCPSDPHEAQRGLSTGFSDIPGSARSPGTKPGPDNPVSCCREPALQFLTDRLGQAVTPEGARLQSLERINEVVNRVGGSPLANPALGCAYRDQIQLRSSVSTMVAENRLVRMTLVTPSWRACCDSSPL